ncbi:hypothetical protein KKR91_12300 [Arthrobacter jiangjiafuii]|uniref:Flp pilus assembly protein TadG n=2 Tax=Arthrobacter jiangjiafuii TaxID=2817475 RepID=A0A975R2R6_9MICC|nr:hypothetical protein [Arthrobacter jiangjiafuii]QWC11809.1 hypothetical protein KKR91_12300 [Arthrobacter jiangjiafuii]
MGTWASTPLPAAEECDAEEGSAVVEFIFLGLLLLVPVIYLIVTAGQVQGASFAAVGAAESAAKVYVAAGDPVRAEQQARAAAELAFTDFGFEPEAMLLEIACSAQCLTPGSTVTAEVRFDVPLPLAPGIPGMEFAPVTVDSAATQMVERYG